MNIFALMGGVFAFLGVALGAFGAHFLKSKLSPDALIIFEVGVRYQFYHALALVAFIGLPFQNSYFVAAGWAFVAGVILFSGSLYLLALTGVKGWGAVTPVGGLLFLIGWICFIVGLWKK